MLLCISDHLDFSFPIFLPIWAWQRWKQFSQVTQSHQQRCFESYNFVLFLCSHFTIVIISVFVCYSPQWEWWSQWCWWCWWCCVSGCVPQPVWCWYRSLGALCCCYEVLSIHYGTWGNGFILCLLSLIFLSGDIYLSSINKDYQKARHRCFYFY